VSVCTLWTGKVWCTHHFFNDILPREAITIHKPTMYTLDQFIPPSEQLYIRGANLCCDITQYMPQETNAVVVLSLLLFNGLVKGGRHCIACTGNTVSSLQPCHSHNVPTNAPQMLACSDSTVGALFSLPTLSFGGNSSLSRPLPAFQWGLLEVPFVWSRNAILVGGSQGLADGVTQ